jgi:hypothetical protein
VKLVSTVDMYNSFENGQSEKQEHHFTSPIEKGIGPERKA